MNSQRGIAATKENCFVCLRSLGMGSTTIRKTLSIGKATISRWMQRNGFESNPLRNGVALKGTGKRFTERERIAKLRVRQAVLKEIKQSIQTADKRVRQCLSQRAPKPTEAEAFKSKYHNDLPFRITHILRSRVRKVVKRGDRYSEHTLNWLGCTPLELIAHLETLWTDGMTWSNYGCQPGQWSFDHIRPCASFDLLKQSQREACFHYRNLQPMWHIDNIRKSDTWCASA